MEKTSSVLSHIVQKLKEAEVKVEPYPHFFIEEIFPQEFYEQILNNMPDSSDLIATTSGWPTKEDNYHRLNLLQDLNLLTGDVKEFWIGVREIMSSPTLSAAVVELCSAHVMRHRNAWARFKVKALRKYESNYTLHRITDEYELKIHTDARRKIVALLFNLPKDETTYEYGTGVYVPKAKGLTDTGRGNFEFSDFERVYRAPFMENSLFGFVKNDYSFHGVEKIPSEIQGRDVLLYNINLPS